MYIKKYPLSRLTLLVISYLFVICFTNLAAAINESNSPVTPSEKKEGLAKDNEAVFEDKLKIADEHLRLKKYAKAKEFYRNIYLSAEKGRSAEKALFGIGKSDYYLRNYYEARQNIKRFVSLSHDSEYVNEAYLLLGYISLYLQKFKEADQYFDKVRGDLKDKANIGQAEIALKFNDIIKADSLLLGVDKRLRETDPRALYVRSVIYSRKGMHRDAVNTINKILAPVLKEHDFRVDKAQVFLYAGKFKEAEAMCKSIISDPISNLEKLMAKKVLLDIYEAENRQDDALKLSLDLLPYEPGDDLKLKIIALYDKKGDIDNAMRYLTFLRNKRHKSSELEKRLKNIISSHNPKSLEYFVKFSGYIDIDSPFIVDASRYLITNGKRFEGMAILRKSLRGAVRGDASLYLSELLIDEKKYAEARKILEPLTLDSRYLYRASHMIADIMERDGKYEPAIEYLMKIVKTAKDYRIAAKLGDLYYKTGDRTNALKYYIIASYKGDGISSVKAGDCLYISGNYAKAKVYYKKALGYALKDPKILQWAQYQYGKLTGNKDYLKKAAAGGGDIAVSASIILGGN